LLLCAKHLFVAAIVTIARHWSTRDVNRRAVNARVCFFSSFLRSHPGTRPAIGPAIPLWSQGGFSQPPAFLRTAEVVANLLAAVLQHGVSASFSRHGHAIILLRKLSQLSATGLIGEAIGQRPAFLSAGVPAFRACNRPPDAVVVLIPAGHIGNNPGEGTIKARYVP
jgi:hypothetical protein